MKKWQDQGYWVSKLFYWQSMGYYLANCIRFRSITFFSVCNPALSFGGMLDDDKTEAYRLIDEKYLPKTWEYDAKVDLVQALEDRQMQFPVIVKPNMGFKGYAVRECMDMDDLQQHLAGLDQDRSWLIQEYIDLEREYSVMYYRSIDRREVSISSFTIKEYPAVIGDGVQNMKQLILQLQNAYVDKEHLLEAWADQLDFVPDRREKVILHHVGNYSRGSKFYSVMDDLDDAVKQAMHEIFEYVPGIHFCRVDLKAASMAALKRGAFKIMEVNGAKSEPLHIYDPSMSWRDRVKEIRHHWRFLIDLVKEQRCEREMPFPSTRDGLKSLFAVKRMVK